MWTLLQSCGSVFTLTGFGSDSREEKRRDPHPDSIHMKESDLDPKKNDTITCVTITGLSFSLAPFKSFDFLKNVYNK